MGRFLVALCARVPRRGSCASPSKSVSARVPQVVQEVLLGVVQVVRLVGVPRVASALLRKSREGHQPKSHEGYQPQSREGSQPRSREGVQEVQQSLRARLLPEEVQVVESTKGRSTPPRGL